MALLESLPEADDGNFLRALAETVLHILMPNLNTEAA